MVVGGVNKWTMTDYDTVTESGKNPVSKHGIQPECGKCAG